MIWDIRDLNTYHSLLILALGFFINAITSVAGPILAMCGQEFVHSAINIVTIIIQAIFALYLYTDICV